MRYKISSLYTKKIFYPDIKTCYLIYSRMSLSYKDALVLGKPTQPQVKPAPKKVYKTFSTGEIKKMCIWGKLAELKQVNPAVFTKPAIELFVKTMTDKLDEIAIWKYEDQNQYDDTLNELNEREEGIKKCKEYVCSFIKKEQVDTKPVLQIEQIHNMCVFGKFEELRQINTSVITLEIAENLISELKRKLMDVETWKTEDENQSEHKQNELSNRADGILQCINWLGTLYQKLTENNLEV